MKRNRSHHTSSFAARAVTMKRCLIALYCAIFMGLSEASPVVNVYAWNGEIPKKLIQQFEKETGITVNFSTYDSNEILYAKLKSSRESIYDVILPSAYYVERMQKQHMLLKLDHTLLSNITNIDPFFTKNDYDSGNQYSVPMVWGSTGIFYNQTWAKKAPTQWSQLWDSQWKDQLLMLDDPREVFSIALMSLRYDPNDTNPKHIKEAYQKLLKLVPNIKLFASDGLTASMIDEDAIAGIAWNNDVYKAHIENKALRFVYPKEGFVIWVDCLAIPINPPHPTEAYQFINFILRASSSVQIAQNLGLAITNRAGKKQLSYEMRHNEVVYPSKKILTRGHIQRDVGEQAITLYNQYWQDLKLAF